MSQSIESLRKEVSLAYKNSFMKPDVFETKSVSIDGENGVVVIPLDEISISLEENEPTEYEDFCLDDMEAVSQAYQNHFHDNADVYTVEVKEGFVYRLSASGYMDCTDYAFTEDEETALKELLNQVD